MGVSRVYRQHNDINTQLTCENRSIAVLTDSLPRKTVDCLGCRVNCIPFLLRNAKTVKYSPRNTYLCISTNY